MADQVGSPLVFRQKWAFTVEIDDVTIAGFTTCSEYKRTFGMVEQRQGGQMGPVDVTPSTWKLEDITLGRGASQNTELADWEADQVAGRPAKRNVSIVMNDAEGNPLERINMDLCSMVSRAVGDFDADNDKDNAKETIVIRPTAGTPNQPG